MATKQWELNPWANHRGELHMRRREFLKYSAATALAGSVGYRAARADLPPVKVGVIGAKTGPLAPGAAVTHFPPYRALGARGQRARRAQAQGRAAQDRADRV